MFGFFINLFLVAVAVFEFAWGIRIFIKEKDFLRVKIFIPVFTVFSVMICGGYGLMGILPEITYAYIPRFFGLWGCVALFLTEFAYIIFDLNTKRITQYITIGISCLWGILDLVIYGEKHVLNYIHHDYYNTMEMAIRSAHVFHYIFLGVLGSVLLVLTVKWYKTKKIKRERKFVAHIIIANYIVLFATIPDIFLVNRSFKYPTVSFCIALAINFFVWMSALQQKLSFNMSVKNVSEGIFDTIDVPIIIFSESGRISLYNPSAQKFLGLKDSENISIRDIFHISDVEEMRLLAKAKKGEDYLLKSTSNTNGKMCLLKCYVKLDFAGEPYCIIGTILTNTQELNNEEGNL